MKDMKVWNEKAVKQVEDFSFTVNLAAGSWTRIQITLSPAKAEDIKAIELRMKTDNITLRAAAR
jgi:hypothetical protein